jgi:hypothetical protein
MSNLKPGDKVKVLDSSYSYYFGKDGLKRAFCLNQGGEYEVVQAGVKMPMWYRVSGKEISRRYDDVSDNDTLIKDSAGKIISIQERFLEKGGKGLSPKFKAGDKVVPVSKSVFSDDCPSWENGKCRFPFLFVNGIDEEETRECGKIVYTCNWERDGEGDYYTESDLRPYVEPPKRKFKVGDIIKGNAISKLYYYYTNSDMTKGEVIEVKDGGKILIKILEHKCITHIDSTIYDVEEKYFDLVDEPKKEAKPINHCPQDKATSGHGVTLPDFIHVPIKIIHNGPATICVLSYDGKQFKGTAKCNPADTYDEATGQIIACERATIELSKYRIAQATK